MKGLRFVLTKLKKILSEKEKFRVEKKNHFVLAVVQKCEKKFPENLFIRKKSQFFFYLVKLFPNVENGGFRKKNFVAIFSKVEKKSKLNPGIKKQENSHYCHEYYIV